VGALGVKPGNTPGMGLTAPQPPWLLPMKGNPGFGTGALKGKGIVPWAGENGIVGIEGENAGGAIGLGSDCRK